jgi:hypothetical protein
LSKAAFPNLIIGTVERIADDDETQTVFDWVSALSTYGPGFLRSIPPGRA